MAVRDLLNEEQAVNYIKENTDLFCSNAQLSAQILNSQSLSVNGLANNLILIEDEYSGQKVILKEVLPYVRQAAEDNVHIPLPQQRIYAEYYSIKLMEEICPGAVPEIYLFDEENNIFIFEYLENMELLRSELIRGNKYSHLGENLADFLARKAFFTSQFFLDEEDYTDLVDFFEKSKAVEVWDKFIFLGAVLDASDKSINPYLEEEIVDFRSKKYVRQNVEELRHLFKNKKQCLIHGDFHTSNIFVNEKEIKIFDTEFSMYGPSSYDMGRLLANIILNYASLISEAYSKKRKDFQIYLIKLIEEIYEKFICLFRRYFEEFSEYDNSVLEDYFDNYLSEVISFTGCTMIMRIYEEGLCLDFKRITNLKQRSLGQGFIIQLAEKLFKKHEELENIKDLTNFIYRFSLEYEVSQVVSLILEVSKNVKK
mgnify:CR=1 FL=1